jgi:hypothetical protein
MPSGRQHISSWFMLIMLIYRAKIYHKNNKDLFEVSREDSLEVNMLRKLSKWLSPPECRTISQFTDC